MWCLLTSTLFASRRVAGKMLPCLASLPLVFLSGHDIDHFLTQSVSDLICLPYSQADVFDFAPTHLEEGVSIADPTTHLVVIKQVRSYRLLHSLKDAYTMNLIIYLFL